MPKITKVWAREILDSRGAPTVEAACQVDSGAIAVASVPSGVSTGTYEALELRDGDESRYKGKGVLKAVNNINQVISPAITMAGIEVTDQIGLDRKLLELDATENKSRLGANALLAVSLAACKTAASSQKMPLYKWVQGLAKLKGIERNIKVPTPIFNMINGGLHGAGNLDFQEFFTIPATSKPFSEGLRMGVEIYMTIGQNLAHRGAIHSVGDEGGYAPNLFTNADALEVLVEAIRQTNYQIGRDVFLGLDVAASTFYGRQGYSLKAEKLKI